MEDIGERLKTEFPQSKLTQRMQDLLYQLAEAERLAKFHPPTETRSRSGIVQPTALMEAAMYSNNRADNLDQLRNHIRQRIKRR